jgi:hypothetical protein
MDQDQAKASADVSRMTSGYAHRMDPAVSDRPEGGYVGANSNRLGESIDSLHTLLDTLESRLSIVLLDSNPRADSEPLNAVPHHRSSHAGFLDNAHDRVDVAVAKVRDLLDRLDV